jgi:NADH dehydrogenase FAD-containing subunit
MKLIFISALSCVSGSGPTVVDSSGMLSQYSQSDKVCDSTLLVENFPQILSSTSRDLLTQFQKDLDDLGARMGANTFGRAETIDPLLFRSIR